MVTDQGYRSKAIELNEVEEKLRSLLLDVANWIDGSPSKEPPGGEVKLPADVQHEPLVLRFTGGWVRDKLLGVTSHDIDVAINKMTGFQFGLSMKEYLEIPGKAAKYGLDGANVAGGLHKIEANPEKSKHLETVTTKIFGCDIDLVNLRKETYTEDSRNPQMEFGTPEEDAFRRDATVNAMFYNLNTRAVEDFTQKGFSDLQLERMCTPLEPYQTFKDDPLRVLRLIRFATRLDYSIDPTVQEAMKDQAIKDALRVKISRERVGIELEKMLKGKRPRAALGYIYDLGLYETIFTDPAQTPRYSPDLDKWPAICEYMLALENEHEIHSSSLRSQLLPHADDFYQAWVSTALIPWSDAPLPPPPKKNRQPIPLVVTVAQEGFKAPNRVSNVLAASMLHLDEIRQVVDKFSLQKRYPEKRRETEDLSARDVLGLYVRKWGSSWRQQVLYALLYEIYKNPESTTAIEKSFGAFVDYVYSLKLADACDIKSLVDGKTLSKALGVSPGPWMSGALDVIVAWQLKNPDVRDPQVAIQALKEELEVSASQGQSKAKDERTSEQEHLASSLRRHFLQDLVKPLFMHARPHASVTPQGREKLDSTPRRDSQLFSEEDAQKHWKRDTFVLPILQWSLASLTPSSTEVDWPLLIPPILALIDDHETRHKVVGCNLLRQLLSKTPTSLLTRTGLAGVFEEAVTPCLSYLPTLTPVEESVQMLDAAYPCLLQLARTRFPTGPSRIENPGVWDAKVAQTTKLVRHGVLHGMMMAGEYPPVATCLLSHLATLLSEEGIDSVRHLKEVVPLLASVLGDPFALAYPPLLIAATAALQSVVLNGWPRMHVWKGEVLKGPCLLWVRIVVEGKGKEEELEALMTELKVTVRMLNAALKKDGKEGLAKDADTLIEAEPKLVGLFKGLELIY